MPDVYISRSGMENKQLDEKFKATELEEIQKQLNKERFERQRIQEEIKKEISELKQNIISEIKDSLKKKV